ncbi:hypothetical protein N2152v2_007838 [Parachlorella kessleri]
MITPEADLADVEQRKVVVLGVPWNTTDDTLEQHFSRFGRVEEAQIMREKYTGKSRGFGFVTFGAPADAHRAVASDHEIDGRKCEAKFALPEGKVGSARTTRIFVARIPASVTDQQFRAYFEQFGAVQDAYMPKDPSKQGHRGIGFVTYATASAVERVMSQTHTLNGNEIAIDRATPKEKSSLLLQSSGRLSMSQPNLQLLGGSGHGGSHFAFMGGAPRGGGLPSSPPRFGGESVLGGMAGAAGGAGHASLGDRRMSHPSLPAMFSSPPQRPPSSSPESMSAAYQQALPSLASYGSHGNLGSLMGLQAQLAQAQAQVQAQAHAQAQAQAAALQLGAAGAGVPSSAGALDTSSPSQLISLLSANAAVAAAAAAAGGGGLPPATAGSAAAILRSSPSMGQLSLSRGSSHNDLVGLLAQQQQQQQEQQIGVGKPPLPGGWHAAAAAAAGLPPMRPSASMPSVQGTIGPASARAGPRIFVGKLNKDTSEQDVKDYFIRFGYVMDVYLPRDKNNKREHRGFGFVTFETEAAIQRVVAHGPHQIKGSIVAIDSAVPRQDEVVLSVDGTPLGGHAAGAGLVPDMVPALAFEGSGHAGGAMGF